MSLQIFVRGGGALALSLFCVDLTFTCGVVYVGVSVLLTVWVAGPSGVDISTMLMEVLEVTVVS